MYKVGDHVVYGSHGVCHILDTEERRIDGKTRHFFVLEPLEQPGTKFYIPSQNPTALAKLRPVMTRLELDTLLSSRESHRQKCPHMWPPPYKVNKGDKHLPA